MMSRDAARRRVLVAWLPVVLYTLLIWWLSSQRIDFALLDRVPLKDKGVHFLEYGALSFFSMHAIAITWSAGAIPTVAAATVITTGLGVLDELHQSFVPGRSSDVLDLVADVIGALTWALIYAGISAAFRYFKRTRAPNTLTQ